MPDDWKTPSQPRLIGHLNDAHGRSVALSVDRGDVLIRRGGQDIRLGADERDTFMRIYVEAERQAEAWAVVDAEVWCATEDEAADVEAAGPCPFVAVLGVRGTPCTFPRGHELPHSFGTAATAAT